MTLLAALLVVQSAFGAEKVLATKSFPAKAVRRVVARVEAGRIKVKAGRGSQASVKAVKPKDSEGHCDLHLRLNQGTLELSARKPKGKHEACDGGFVVTVPPDASVEAQAGSGDIEATGMTRAVRARAGSGSIRLKDVLGQVYAVTGSGDIHANLRSAAFDARTGSGNVHVSLASPSGLVSARTGSGNIDIALPKDSKLRLRAKTGSGKLASVFTNDPKAPLVVEATTGSGDVTLAPAAPEPPAGVNVVQTK